MNTNKGVLNNDRLDNMTAICDRAVEVLKIKNPKYGDSWKSKGGFSAFFNLDRKWSRVETLAAKYGYDIFEAIQQTIGQPDGMVEALSDLMGYDILILDDQCETSPELGPDENGVVRLWAKGMVYKNGAALERAAKNVSRMLVAKDPGDIPGDGGPRS